MEEVGLGTTSCLLTGKKDTKRNHKFSWIDLRGSKVMNLRQIKPEAFYPVYFLVYLRKWQIFEQGDKKMWRQVNNWFLPKFVTAAFSPCPGAVLFQANLNDLDRLSVKVIFLTFFPLSLTYWAERKLTGGNMKLEVEATAASLFQLMFQVLVLAEKLTICFYFPFANGTH